MLNKKVSIQTNARVGEKRYTGICVAQNDEILMLLNFNEESSIFDGFTIFRDADVDLYREWDDADLALIKQDNSKEQLSEINLTGFKSFDSALQELDSKLISVFTTDDFDSYYVGALIEINENIISLKLMSENGDWLDTIELEVDTIWYIGFDTIYEKELEKSALN